MILATTIILSLRAVETAHHAAVAARETRAATQILRNLLDAAPQAQGTIAGGTGDFDWRLDTQLVVASKVPPGAALCRHSALAVNRRTRRRYELATADICPAGAPT